MRKKAVLFALTCAIFSAAICPAIGHAQNSGAYLVPRTVYVGDPATLVVPLPPAPRDSVDVVLRAQAKNLSTEDIDITRITLERRVSGNRLLVEFTAYVPGVLELPSFEIDGERFSGLTAAISSIIDAGAVSNTGANRSLELSGAASTLAIPGTAMMIYGTLSGVVFLILLAIWIFFRGRLLFLKIQEKWKRWSFFIYMRSSEKNLGRLLLKGGDKREILDKLSEQFRLFLSFFTGNNCRAMTAREFEEIASAVHIDGVFLKNFFRRCDNLRFSGAQPKNEDISRLLSDLRTFLTAAEKEKTHSFIEEKERVKKERAA